MLTFAKAWIVDHKKHLSDWCEERGLDYSRISKLVSGTPGYVPRQDERAEMGAWLGLPPELVFTDAGMVLHEHVAKFVRQRRRKR